MQGWRGAGRQRQHMQGRAQRGVKAAAVHALSTASQLLTILLLQLHPIANRSQIVAQVQAASGLHARQNPLPPCRRWLALLVACLTAAGFRRHLLRCRGRYAACCRQGHGPMPQCCCRQQAHLPPQHPPRRQRHGLTYSLCHTAAATACHTALCGAVCRERLARGAAKKVIAPRPSRRLLVPLYRSADAEQCEMRCTTGRCSESSLSSWRDAGWHERCRLCPRPK